MKIIIDLDTNNSAFDNFNYKLGQILDKVKTSITEKNLSARKLYDFNGNNIGKFSIDYTENNKES